MKKITTIVIIFIAVIIGGSLTILNLLETRSASVNELASLQKTLADQEARVAILTNENDAMTQKLDEARSYALFLSLALCPTLEAENKDSFCAQNGAEWLEHTIKAGIGLPDEEMGSGIQTLVQTIGNTKRPSSKQFYDLLRPLEKRALDNMVTVTK